MLLFLLLDFVDISRNLFILQNKLVLGHELPLIDGFTDFNHAMRFYEHIFLACPTHAHIAMDLKLRCARSWRLVATSGVLSI